MSKNKLESNISEEEVTELKYLVVKQNLAGFYGKEIRKVLDVEIDLSTGKIEYHVIDRNTRADYYFDTIEEAVERYNKIV
jgi:sporulation protein YlmC with PRC-barrel domain